MRPKNRKIGSNLEHEKYKFIMGVCVRVFMKSKQQQCHQQQKSYFEWRRKKKKNLNNLSLTGFACVYI